MLRSVSWRQIIHHGEIVGFLAAWAVGIVVALAGQATDDQTREPDGLAIVSAPPKASDAVK